MKSHYVLTLIVVLLIGYALGTYFPGVGNAIKAKL